MLLSAVFVNGATDAPNAIACCVGSGAMSFKKASLMAAIMNFLGAILSYLTLNGVFKTFLNTIDYSIGINNVYIVVFSCLLTVVLWAVVAWCFGIPTSESHALGASLAGALLSMGSFDIKTINNLLFIIFSLILSCFICFIIAFIVPKIFNFKINYKASQIIMSALCAFMHGAQDTQKFAALFIGLSLKINPLLIYIICSVIMALGTFFAGKKITKKVSSEMVTLSLKDGFFADISSFISLFICLILSMPASTTSVKTTSIMGVCLFDNSKKKNKKIMMDMILTWIITFPACFILGYLISALLRIL